MKKNKIYICKNCSYKNILPESVIVEHRTVGDDEIVKVEFMIRNENYFYDVNTINCKDINDDSVLYKSLKCGTCDIYVKEVIDEEEIKHIHRIQKNELPF